MCVAAGAKYQAMSMEFVQSIRKYEPKVPIFILTDGELLIEDRNVVVETELNLEGNWYDKYIAIRRSPFKKTIYLDVDILPVNPFVKQLTKVLDYCDVSLRSGMCFNIEEEREFPTAISQMNTGVLLINSKVRKQLVDLTLKFRMALSLNGKQNDQIAFRMAILELKPHFYELSSDFNFMTGFEQIIEKVTLVHFAGNQGKLLDEKWRSRAFELSSLPPGTVVMNFVPFHIHKHFASISSIFPVIFTDKLLNIKFRIFHLLFIRYKR